MKKILTLVLLSCLLLANKPADDFISVLKQKLEEYAKNNPSDQAILVFNQEKYAASDTVFFQTYLVNEDMQAVKGKKILALNIFDKEGKSIQKINFSVMNGRANNQLAISPQTPSGVYLLAVTYAQNLTDESAILFTREIVIVEKRQLSITKNKALHLSVSYEGGLVADIENTIILQSNASGTGKITNSKNEEVVQFSLTKNKIAAITFTPSKGQTYTAELEGGIKTPLITVKNDGSIIKIAPISNTPTRKITVLTSPNESQKKQHLVITNRRKVVFSALTLFDGSGKFEVNLPKEVIKNGISYATLFDDKGNVLSERAFFKYESAVTALLTTTTSDVTPRKKISLDLSVKDQFGNPVQGEFSVSVYQSDLFADAHASSFIQEVLLRYPTNLAVENNFINGALTEDAINQIDYSLAGKSFNSSFWPAVLNYTSKANVAVSSSLKLKGKVIYTTSGKAVPDSTLIMGYLQNNMIGYVGYTSKEGRFDLPFLYDFFGDDELFYLLEQNGKEITEPFTIIPDETKLSLKPFSNFTLKDSLDGYGDYVQKKRIVDNSFNFYNSKSNKGTEGEDLNTRFEEEAMGVDMNVNVQEYISFPTMEDLVREVIPFLQNKKKGNTATVRLLINQNTKNTNYTFAKGEPLFIIDGVLTKNINSFLGMKPVDILTIKIINDNNKLNRLGPLGKNGVVLVKTKKPSKASVAAGSHLLNIQGLTKPKSYYNPNYASSNNSSNPDIRSVLYWTPLQTYNQSGKSNLEFFASDKVGTYTVHVKGLSAQGEPFEATTKINVNFN
jgi:hypothetical protein